MGSEKRWKHSSRVAWRKVAAEAVILDVETAVYFSLTGAGMRMWELLGKGQTPAQIAGALAAEYDASETVLAKDCADLAAKLSRKRLLEPA